ncbi:ParB-like nuclease domain [Rubrobacter radiotolerans]|uniref:ParB N-terminal domain-containing protein n=1 Tax=Rubrobacter radiotolerans TaxID=42256 RepID=A0A023X293_RUBRA|nr:ParB N-terminal domain-containing protein [Rubrobacter radiotolerans]AHY46184.1 ParB-like nuclease domain [Rubrobacter radiotolerans]MDX5893593.1 ParB N-terminal domain-containing protein [Rubrobacter radiotolerans]SMC04074.1 ParB-like nuclease domain-containing protein [Rubrobacter radiotolerans DSM 5868]
MNARRPGRRTESSTPHRASPELGDLRVVPLGSLLLHEAHDPARLARLAERMQAEGMQRNPIIVSPTVVRPRGGADEGYLVLDGAHRAGALDRLGSPLALVQVVELPSEAEGWRHLFEVEAGRTGSPADWLEETLPGTGVLRLAGTRGERSSEGAAVAEVELPGGERFAVLPGEGSGRAEALRRLQGLYPSGGGERNGVLRRLAPGESVRPRGSEVLVEYRPLPTAEILADISSGGTLPAGITRFRVPGRVLGVRLPLEELLSGDRAAAGRALSDLVARHVRENRVRRYEEPVTLFE